MLGLQLAVLGVWVFPPGNLPKKGCQKWLVAFFRGVFLQHFLGARNIGTPWIVLVVGKARGALPQKPISNHPEKPTGSAFT